MDSMESAKDIPHFIESFKDQINMIKLVLLFALMAFKPFDDNLRGGSFQFKEKGGSGTCTRGGKWKKWKPPWWGPRLHGKRDIRICEVYYHGSKANRGESVKFITMPQKRIEEKLETIDQEISGIQAELHELPTIKEDISSLAKSTEKQGVQAEKQQ
ncbi:uncharacterized protein E6C27_scaffold409G001040 [Cucumis melo var. makuwa]|nr:uncharacterized protein E6C27_scaffold409G001040 [Cucumis melo var. makuwa]